MELQDYSKRKIEESQQFLKNYKPDWLHKKIDSYLFAWVKVLDLWCGPATFDEFHHTIPMDYYGVDHDQRYREYSSRDEQPWYSDRQHTIGTSGMIQHIIDHVHMDNSTTLPMTSDSIL